MEPALYLHVTENRLLAVRSSIKLCEIAVSIGELESACNRKIEAAADFTNICKLVALKSGLDAAVLATYITARCNDTLAKKEKQAEQLTILFDEKF